MQPLKRVEQNDPTPHHQHSPTAETRRSQPTAAVGDWSAARHVTLTSATASRLICRSVHLRLFTIQPREICTTLVTTGRYFIYSKDHPATKHNALKRMKFGVEKSTCNCNENPFTLPPVGACKLRSDGLSVCLSSYASRKQHLKFTQFSVSVARPVMYFGFCGRSRFIFT